MLIKVIDGKNKTFRFRKELRNLGFAYCSEPTPHWRGEVSEDKLCEIEEWCFKRRLAIVSPTNERSADYRRVFFENNTGNLSSGKYLCVYCGRILRKDSVSVDHLISVKKAQSSKYALNLIKKRGLTSVNDVRNLVPSCKRCNSRKGAKGRFWVLRGRLGSHIWFWVVIRLIEVLIIIGAVCLGTRAIQHTQFKISLILNFFKFIS